MATKTYHFNESKSLQSSWKGHSHVNDDDLQIQLAHDSFDSAKHENQKAFKKIYTHYTQATRYANKDLSKELDSEPIPPDARETESFFSLLS